MRPPEFTGGNSTSGFATTVVPPSFNEAAGIHRRKLASLKFSVTTVVPLQ